MAKRSDTLETVLLAIELLRRVPKGRKVTAKELHLQLKDAGFDRDLRTIQRQIETLSEHFDIERDDRSRPYGYRWLEKAKGLAVPNLTPHESLLLQLAEEHLRNLLPVKVLKSLDGFFSQARYNLDVDGTSKLESEWRNKVRVVSSTQPLLPPKIAVGVFESVSNALYGNKWLFVCYRNAAGVTSDADVMPLGLAQQGPRLYLVCRFKGFENERSLAVHRIMSAKVSTFTFQRPKEFDLKRYDDDGRFGVSDGTRIVLTFSISRDAGLHLLESPLSVDQDVKVLDDGYRIKSTIVETDILYRWLQSFGNDVWDVEIDRSV